jgi:hypothetical protein
LEDIGKTPIFAPHELHNSIIKATSNEEQKHHLSKQRASGFVADITYL